jgi:hypothetical protein
MISAILLNCWIDYWGFWILQAAANERSSGASMVGILRALLHARGVSR